MSEERIKWKVFDEIRPLWGDPISDKLWLMRDSGFLKDGMKEVLEIMVDGSEIRQILFEDNVVLSNVLREYLQCNSVPKDRKLNRDKVLYFVSLMGNIQAVWLKELLEKDKK